jgi:hypothetical protein
LSLSNNNIRDDGAMEEDDETIVIKLMANMFSKKKSVREKLLMDPNISIDKLKKEIRWKSIEEQSNVIKLARSKFLKDR